jgi:hypothetical protein
LDLFVEDLNTMTSLKKLNCLWSITLVLGFSLLHFGCQM